MAYSNELPLKHRLMSSIRILAIKLEVLVHFDDPELIAYGDLVSLHDNLLNQYNEKIFLSQGLKENGFK